MKLQRRNQEAMRFHPRLQNASIAVIGNFNPTIFSPAWFRLHNLINDFELDAAKIAVIHSQATDFVIDTLHVQVTPQKAVIQNSELPFVRVADMTLAIFGKLLVHTPLSQVGINYQLHFDVESLKRRNALGRTVAPIEPWGAWATNLERAEPPKAGGLRSISMEEVNPDGRLQGGFRRVTLEPSLAPGLEASGVFMAINDHYELGQSATTTQLLVETLEANFDASIETSMGIVTDIMALAAGLQK